MFLDSNDLNRYVMTLLFLSQATLATLLSVAWWKNHFVKKRIRPAVAVLALYVGFGALQTFFRLIARMIVANGGDADAFVQGWPWTVANLFYTVTGILLLIVLVRAYPGSHSVDLHDRLHGHVKKEGKQG